MSGKDGKPSADADSGIGKFILGTAVGAAMAFGYVRFDFAKPEVLELPDQLRGNLISTAAEYDLYDLEKDAGTHLRALEIFFLNRAKFAATVDAEYGHPFLKALYRKRVTREARQLRLAWSGFDKALEKPALLEVLVKRYGTSDPVKLKQAMLLRQLESKEFLKLWLEKNMAPVEAGTLLNKLTTLSRLPDPRQPPTESK